MRPDTATPTTRPATWVEWLRHRAATQGDRVGYRFLVDGDTEETTLTYAELDREARAVAVLLRGVAAVGERAMLLHPPGLELIAAFFGCLYAGIAAVPLPPPRSSKQARAVQRLRSVVNAAQPTVALTTVRSRPAMTMCFHEILGEAATPCLPTNDLAADLGRSWQSPEITQDSTACIQFTSGATGDPRGVVLTHANLLHNSAIIRDAFGHSAESRGVIWLPPYHDMGLVGGVLQPLFAGFPVTLMSPTAFLQQPFRWLRAIHRYRATTSGGPNFAYDLCVDRTSDAERSMLDLSSWQVAFCGAEPVRHETLNRFAEAFAPSGFERESLYPCYGLAEATLMVSGGERQALPVVKTIRREQLKRGGIAAGSSEAIDARTLVSCGRVLGGQIVAIVDPQTCHRYGADQIGEVWVRGPCVAKGYWNNVTAEQETFAAHIADGDGPYLRTGDLGFVSDGELFITGRLKDLIIIRGVHYYPQDIEHSAQRSHAALLGGTGAAFAVETRSGEGVMIVHEVRREERASDGAPIIEAIRQTISEEHELPLEAVALLRPGQLPKTSSGKVQRRACRDAFLAGTLDALTLWLQPPVASEAGARGAGGSEIFSGSLSSDTHATLLAMEAWLAEKFASRLKIAGGDLDPNEPFARYGLDSLGAVEVALQISDELRQALPRSLFWDYPNIRSLARYLVENRGTGQSPPAEPMIEKG